MWLSTNGSGDKDGPMNDAGGSYCDLSDDDQECDRQLLFVHVAGDTGAGAGGGGGRSAGRGNSNANVVSSMSVNTGGGERTTTRNVTYAPLGQVSVHQ